MFHRLLLVISVFFFRHKESMLVRCNDKGLFSYCQEAYIFRYNHENRTCNRFYRSNCMIINEFSIDTNTGYTGVTLVTHLSYIHFY